MGLIFILVPFALLWAFMIVPQQRKMKAQRSTVSAAAVDDEVMLTSGIYGVISEIDGDVVFLEIAPDIEIKIAKAAISRVIRDDAAASDQKAIGTPDAASNASDDKGDGGEEPKKFGWTKK